MIPNTSVTIPVLCLPASTMTAAAALIEPTHWENTTQVGIAGLVVTLVTAPFVRWTLKRLDTYHQDTAQIRKLLEELLTVVKNNSTLSTTTSTSAKPNSAPSSEP